ncbi:MAG TPA: translation initiation factor IF-5A [Candidatus Acidoferrum sp.]|nr:translation initiation factor IF-5A [Candidatus Acidoferrum sp.]
MGEETMLVSMKDVKVGRYILIDGVPCKVVDIETSAPGKHGSAKMRVTAIGMFEGQKKTLLMPSHGMIEAPIINKKKAQVVSVGDTNAQLMDSETYEVYEVPIIEEFVGKMKPGMQVEVIEAMGRKALSRMLSNE